MLAARSLHKAISLMEPEPSSVMVVPWDELLVNDRPVVCCPLPVIIICNLLIVKNKWHQGTEGWVLAGGGLTPRCSADNAVPGES